MSTYTPYLDLEKFTTSERLDVLKINANTDKIDSGVSALNIQLPNKTNISATSTNYTDVWEIGNMAILVSRRTYTVAITNQSGGNYWGEVSPESWGYTFGNTPTVVTDTRSGQTNGWSWQHQGATDSLTPGVYIARGTSATSTIVINFIAIGMKGSVS